MTYTDLVAGIYSFQVKATDAAGNISPMYAKTWAVAPEPGDLVPNTTVASGPAKDAWVLSHRTAFDVVSSIPGAAYIVTLNDRYVGTSSTDRVVVSGLTTGRNVITIRAIKGTYADQTRWCAGYGCHAGSPGSRTRAPGSCVTSRVICSGPTPEPASRSDVHDA